MSSASLDWPRLVQHSDRLEQAVTKMIRGDLKQFIPPSDIVAETLRYAYERPEHWQETPEDRIIFYLVKMARFQINNRIRAIRNHREILAGGPSDLPEMEGEAPLQETSPVRNIHRGEKQRAAGKILARLKHGAHRDVIKMVWLQGKSIKETAQALGRTPGATSVLLHNAIAACRNIARRNSFAGFRVSGETL